MYKHGDFEDFYSLDHVTRDNIFEFMKEYVNEVSRERTFEFLKRFSGINPDEPVVNEAYDEYFNQEDKKT